MVSADIKGKQITWKIWENGTTKEITASMAGSFYKNNLDGHQYAATACWRGTRSLEMEIRRLDAVSGCKIIFRFADRQVKLEVDDTVIAPGGLGMFRKNLVPFQEEETE